MSRVARHAHGKRHKVLNNITLQTAQHIFNEGGGGGGAIQAQWISINEVLFADQSTLTLSNKSFTLLEYLD